MFGKRVRVESDERFLVDNLIETIGGVPVVKEKTQYDDTVKLFDNVINTVIKKFGGNVIPMRAFHCYLTNQYYDKKVLSKVKKYLQHYFMLKNTVFGNIGKTYEKLNYMFSVGVLTGVKSYKDFMHWGEYYWNLKISAVKKNTSEKKDMYRLPSVIEPKVDKHDEISMKRKNVVPNTPVFKDPNEESRKVKFFGEVLNSQTTAVNQVIENAEVTEKEVPKTKQKKELTNLDILYREYRKVNNKVKKLEKEEIDRFDPTRELKKNKILSYKKLALQLEQVIYDYKKLNKLYSNNIENSRNIRKLNALKSIERYIKSRKYHVTLENLEEHFGTAQLEYFCELGIDIKNLFTEVKTKQKRK